MKRIIASSFGGALLASLMWLLLGAAAPAPIWRNNFSTNQPPFPVIGDWKYSNGIVGVFPFGATNFFISDYTGITAPSLDVGVLWALIGQGGNSAGVVAQFANGAVQIITNGQVNITVRVPDKAALTVGQANGQLVQPLQIIDPALNVVGYFRTNTFWATTNDFFSTLQTTDNTTNTILTITPRDNSMVRCWVNVVGYNSTASASYGKAATFKSVAGTVTLIGSTATIGAAEDDATYDCLVDTSVNTIRVRVAGNTGRTVNWKCYLNTTYSE